jgi:hypothetical protein
MNPPPAFTPISYSPQSDSRAYARPQRVKWQHIAASYSDSLPLLGKPGIGVLGNRSKLSPLPLSFPVKGNSRASAASQVRQMARSQTRFSKKRTKATKNLENILASELRVVRDIRGGFF